MVPAAHAVRAAILHQRAIVDFSQPRQLRQQVGREPMERGQLADAALRQLQRRQPPLAFEHVPRLRQAGAKVARSLETRSITSGQILPHQRVGDQRLRSPALRDRQRSRTSIDPGWLRSSKGICGPGASNAMACAVGCSIVPPGTRMAGLRSVSLSITRLMRHAAMCGSQAPQHEVLEPHAGVKQLRLVAGQQDRTVRRQRRQVAILGRGLAGCCEQLAACLTGKIRQRPAEQIASSVLALAAVFRDQCAGGRERRLDQRAAMLAGRSQAAANKTTDRRRSSGHVSAQERRSGVAPACSARRPGCAR